MLFSRHRLLWRPSFLSGGLTNFVPIVHGTIVWGQKLYVRVAMPSAPIRVPIQWTLFPSVTSVTSNNNINNEIRQECAQISWLVSYDWGKPRKTSARSPSLRTVIASNGVPYIWNMSEDSHRMSRREIEGKKGRVARNS